MKNLGFVLYNWATVIVWFAFILLMSSLPGVDLQGGYTDWTIRSLGYAMLYAVLFMGIFRALLSTVRMRVGRLMYWKSKREHAEDKEFAHLVEFLLFVVALMSVIILSAFDEFFQSGIEGRVGDFADILVNLMGAVIAALAVYKFPLLAEFEALYYQGLNKGDKKK